MSHNQLKQHCVTRQEKPQRGTLCETALKMTNIQEMPPKNEKHALTVFEVKIHRRISIFSLEAKLYEI